MVTSQKRSALEENYRAFVRLLPELLPDHEGQYALMRDGQVVQYFTSPRRARALRRRLVFGSGGAAVVGGFRVVLSRRQKRFRNKFLDCCAVM